MAALMTSVIDFPNKVAEYILVCRQMGIKILPPDVIAIEIEKNLEKGFDYRKITISDPEEKKAQL